MRSFISLKGWKNCPRKGVFPLMRWHTLGTNLRVQTLVAKTLCRDLVNFDWHIILVRIMLFFWPDLTGSNYSWEVLTFTSLKSGTANCVYLCIVHMLHMDVKLYVDVWCIRYLFALLWFRNRFSGMRIWCTHDPWSCSHIYAHIWNLDTCNVYSIHVIFTPLSQTLN